MPKVKLALIASGSGTDAGAIMGAYRRDFLPDVEIVGLISTKESAGCLEKAVSYGITPYTISRKSYGGGELFAQAITRTIFELEADLVFLVGCIHHIPQIKGVRIFNIHPADPKNHGGKGMYGLDVHKHVLSEVKDFIRQGLKNMNDRFYTYPTINEVVDEYDQGDMLIQAAVEIPSGMIEIIFRDEKMDDQAAILQKLVLKHEWIMLPAAVNLAAERIRSERCK